MSVVLESRIIREFLHGLVDSFVNELEARVTLPTRPISDAMRPAAAPARARSAKPRITLEQKPRKPGRHPRGDVLVGCTKRGKEHQVILTIAAAAVSRLGLGPKFPCDCGLSVVGRTLVLGSGRGARMRGTYAGQRHVLRIGGARRWGVLELHPSEVCAWHFDLEDHLVIQAPAWLKGAAQKARADPPVSCTKLSGPSAPLKCAACGERTATLQCSYCQQLICDSCWETHVPKHWHSKVRGRGPTAYAAARPRA